MAAILVATIGTRDLMFQTTKGEWYNIGDDRMRDGDSIGEQAEVLTDLGFSTITYRDLTKYLLDHHELYLDRLKPVIIGKLLADNTNQIADLYLVGTNQDPSIPQHTKDTIHTCALINTWVQKNHSQIRTHPPLEIGPDHTNPANFEAMFDWWRQKLPTAIQPPTDVEIWLGLKGGVGQSAEAGRISGLSLYGDRIKFFEFQQNEKRNQAGHPSDYSGPFLGTNYLWDRTKQQALKLLDRSDFAGTKELLAPYHQKLGTTPKLLDAGIYWNQGEFQKFLNKAKFILNPSQQQQGKQWWWMAYEQAYLAVVRLEQNNTTEAMLHSFRAVEGCLLEWAKNQFPDHIKDYTNGFPQVKSSILTSIPKLAPTFDEARGTYPHAQWKGSLRQTILELVEQSAKQGDFQHFWNKQCQDIRNEQSHRLGGISEKEVLNAWGITISNSANTEDQEKARSQWKSRILACLNILTKQSFKTIEKSSLFTEVQMRVKRSIEEQ